MTSFGTFEKIGGKGKPNKSALASVIGHLEKGRGISGTERFCDGFRLATAGRGTPMVSARKSQQTKKKIKNNGGLGSTQPEKRIVVRRMEEIMENEDTRTLRFNATRERLRPKGQSARAGGGGSGRQQGETNKKRWRNMRN